MKKCSKCRVEKPKSEYFVSRTSRAKDGLHNVCKECSRNYTRDRNAQVRGATDYGSLINKQDGRCAICGGYETTKGRTLAVDHCHKTGVIRGLLCGKCNRGIGLLQDSPQVLQNAIDYINRARS